MIHRLSFKRFVLSFAVGSTATLSAQTNSYPFPASGNVGIGTASPWTSMHISGPFTPGYTQLMVQSTGPDDRQGIAFYNSAGNRTGIIYTGPASGGDFIFGREQAGQFRFFSNGTERLTIGNSGNVGIGTPYPNTKLAVVAGSLETTSGATLDLSNQSGFVGNHVQLITRLLRTHNHNAWESAAIQLVRRTDVTDQAYITLAGDNVGIGTTSPGSKLDIGGPTGATYGTLTIKQAASGQKGIWLQSYENNNAISIHHNGSHAVVSTDYTGIGVHVPLALQVTGGNVGIGTTNPTHKLAVNGTIKAMEVIVETTGWSDYVFADGYRLAPLSEVEAHIKANKHLPGIPSAEKVASNGVNVGDMQAALLAKIEELTLHIIAQEKELNRLRETETKVAKLETALHQLMQHR